MPIICKISLDASEYKTQLQSVVEETRNFQGSLDDAELNVSADTSAAKEAIADIPQAQDQSATVSVTVDTDAVKDAIADIPQAQDQSVSVSADTDAAKEAIDNLPQAQDQVITITVKENDAKESLLQVNDSTKKLKDTVVSVPVEGFSAKFKNGLSAVRSELNKTSGGAGKFLETFLAGGGGIGIIMAGVASLGKIVQTVYNNWRQRLQENAELHSNNAASIREAAEANEQVRQKTDGYLNRLQELSNQEQLSNANKVEAKKLIDDLSASYGNLGIELDEVTGKLTGVDAATIKKLQRDKANRLSEIETEMKELREEKKKQVKIRETAGVPVWFDGDTRLGGEEETKAAAQKIQELDKKLAELNKRRLEVKRSDPFNEYRKKQKAKVEDLKKSFDDQQESFQLQKEDDAFSAENNVDAKIANRQKLIDRHKKEKLDPLQKKIKRAEELLVSSSGDNRVEAEKNLLELRKELQKELAKSYAWEKQISDVKKQQAQQQAQLKKSIQDQAFNLRGQIMAQTGSAKEFAQENALRSARETKGSDLTESEKKQVLKLAEISFNLSNRRESSVGDMSIKTNSLTARGGFQGGAAVPSADRYNKEISQTSKSLLSTLQRIENICKDLGTF